PEHAHTDLRAASPVRLFLESHAFPEVRWRSQNTNRVYSCPFVFICGRGFSVLPEHAHTDLRAARHVRLFLESHAFPEVRWRSQNADRVYSCPFVFICGRGFSVLP